MRIEEILTKTLIDLIRKISEEQYCAGWMGGVEFDVWAIINNEKSIRYSWELNKTEIESLKYFSKRIDGWVRWPEDGHEPVYVHMDLWNDLYKLEREIKTNPQPGRR